MASTTYTIPATMGEKPSSPARISRVQIALDAVTYTTGGLACDFTGEVDTLAGDTILGVIPIPASGYVFEYDHTNSKLKVYYGDYSEGSDGVLVEHPESALTVTAQFIVLSY